ncbi:WD40-repeat-containing domain protein [Helicostylum pulchrum]|nr:WD40-repeat-containing domain protein [Helicostylum pulchrum]
MNYNSLTDHQIDHIDTDDLMDELDRLPPLRKALVNKKKKKVADRKSRASAKKLAIVKSEIISKKTIEPYDPEKVNQLALENPDGYWKFDAETKDSNMIDLINSDNELMTLPLDICDQGAVTGMTLSDDGALLVTFCNIGAIKIWDIRNGLTCVRHIRDRSESQIDEFYCGQILPDGLLVTGGKLKNRHRWSAEDNDNHILPCAIKIFNVITGERVAKLDGHTEEILCIKAIQFKGNNYLISTSQDGYIIKWHMSEDWTTLLDSTPMVDGVTCMAFTVSFVPNTGNKYFMAACDEHLRLYDFEQAMKKVASKSPTSDDPMQIDSEDGSSFAWFISRGAEMCDVSDGVSSKPNSCTLHKLVYPNKMGGKFELQTVKKYIHEDYHANSWLVKITSNGRYILAPTIYGQLFVFNMKTGKVSAIIKEHEDGYVKVYTYTQTEEAEEAEEEEESEV